MIPNDWKHIKLKDIGDCVRGLTYSPKNVVEKSGILVLRSSNIKSGFLDFSDCVFVDVNISEEVQTIKGDILVCVRNGSKRLIGKNVCIDTNLPNTTHGAFMTVFRTELNSYVRHLFQSEMFFRQVQENLGATINSINTKQLLEYRFLLPPLPEQKKIASILSSVDEAIQDTQEVIDQTEKVKQGLLQELLSKGIGHTEFKNTELGEIPVEWESSQLNKVTSYVDYRGKTPKKTESGIRLITARNVKKGFIDYSRSYEFVAKEAYSEIMKRGFPKIGDILITTEAPFGNIAQIDQEDIALAQRIIKYRGSELLDNSYLKYYMLSDGFQTQLELNSTGGTVKGIKGSRLHKLLVLLPSLEEQQRIASILSSVDKSIQTETKKKEQLIQLKKGLMQDLLTGKVRVKV